MQISFHQKKYKQIKFLYKIAKNLTFNKNASFSKSQVFQNHTFLK